MDIFKLVGSVFVDTDKANESLKKTDEKAKNTGKTFGDVMGKAGQVGAAIVGASAAAVGGMVALASQTASNADEIDKMSIRMGIGAEDLQQYTYAAGLAGVETSTLEKAAKKLEGTDINFDDAMNQIMSLGTAEERSAKAAELFGESVAYQLSPMIEQSGEAFEAAKQEAKELGLVMSEEDVKAGADLNDAMSKVQQSFQAVVTKLGTALMPLVLEFANMILQYMPQIQSFMDQMIPVITQLFSGLMPPLMSLVEELFPVLMDLISEILPVVTEIVSAVLPVLVQLIQMIAPYFVQIVQQILPLVLKLITALLPLLEPILKLLSPILEIIMAVIDPLLKILDMILPPLITILVSIIDFALKPLTAALDLVSQAFGKFGEMVVEAFKSIGKFLKPHINTILGFINNLIDGATKGINNLVRALNKLKINVPSWVTKLTGMSSFGFNLPEITATKIPLLAKGGEVEGSAIVGEDGPELLTNNGNKTKVTPLNDNNNAFVGLEQKLDRLIELMENGFGVYINGQALVGQVASDIDYALGKMANKNARFV